MTMLVNRDDVVVTEGEREEFLEREEVASAYGEDVVRSAETRVDATAVDVGETVNTDEPDEVTRYWQAFLDVLKRSGDLAWAIKTRENADDKAILPVQKVVHEYYEHNLAFLDMDIQARERRYRRAVEVFDAQSQSVGYKPLSKKDREVLEDFLFNQKPRQYCYNNARRHLKNGELLSIRDLVLQYYRVQQRRKAKAASE